MSFAAAVSFVSFQLLSCLRCIEHCDKPTIVLRHFCNLCPQESMPRTRFETSPIITHPPFTISSCHPHTPFRSKILKVAHITSLTSPAYASKDYVTTYRKLPHTYHACGYNYPRMEIMLLLFCRCNSVSQKVNKKCPYFRRVAP